MPTDKDLVDSLVACVPESQRDNVRERVEWALANGWTQLGFWTGCDPKTMQWFPTDESDLFGNPPKGPSDFVPLDVDNLIGDKTED